MNNYLSKKQIDTPRNPLDSICLESDYLAYAEQYESGYKIIHRTDLNSVDFSFTQKCKITSYMCYFVFFLAVTLFSIIEIL